MDIHPFRIEVSQSQLDDLKDRLARTRWPDEPVEAGWAYGTNRSYLKELLDYWQFQFDWRAVEKSLNKRAHFRIQIDGWGIHFIHERAKGPNPFPLLLTHGWPGTFVEMLKIIPLLTDPGRSGADPEDAFDVIVPSLPGYGFSDRPSRPGPWNVHELWAQLLSQLGYERFGAYGSVLEPASRRIWQEAIQIVSWAFISPQLLILPGLPPCLILLTCQKTKRIFFGAASPGIRRKAAIGTSNGHGLKRWPMGSMTPQLVWQDGS